MTARPAMVLSPAVRLGSRDGAGMTKEPETAHVDSLPHLIPAPAAAGTRVTPTGRSGEVEVRWSWSKFGDAYQTWTRTSSRTGDRETSDGSYVVLL